MARPPGKFLKVELPRHAAREGWSSSTLYHLAALLGWRLLFPGWVLILSLATGCADGNRVAGDPFLGNPIAQPASLSSTPSSEPKGEKGRTPASTTGLLSGAASTAPSSDQTLRLPPLTAPSSLTSNAALAAGPAPTLDPGRDLRISDTPPRPSSPGGPNPVPSGQPLETPTRATGRPEALLTQTAGPGGGTRLLSFEHALTVLNSRGVRWQRLESSGPGDWKFTCSVPNRQNPSFSRTYEGRARDHLSAMQVVIDQMEKD